MQFFTTTLGIFATILLGGSTAAAAAAPTVPPLLKGFNASCPSNVTFLADGNNQGPYLISTCTVAGGNKNMTGTTTTTSILPLNHCILNSNGTLVGLESGGFGGSCYLMTLLSDGVTLEASCQSHGYPDQVTGIDLSTIIGVAADGALACYSLKGDIIHL